MLLLGLASLPASAQAPRVFLPVGADRASDAPTRAEPASAIVPPAAVAARVDGFTESFDDITALPAAGWAFQNNSNPVGTASWFQGNPAVFPAYQSEGYVGVNYESTAGGTGTIFNWGLTPEVALENGTELRFWTRAITPGATVYPDRLQVRLSTSGASTNVGASAGDLGDFEELLLEINEELTPDGYPVEWTEQVVTVSGLSAPTTGRFAFLYFVTDAGPSGTNSNYIGIDEVSVSGKVTSGEAGPNAAGATLSAGAPNPFASTTTLTYVLTEPSAVSLDVVDALGRTVASLASGPAAAGAHTATWNAGTAAPGVYVVRLTAGATIQTQRLVLAR